MVVKDIGRVAALLPWLLAGVALASFPVIIGLSGFLLTVLWSLILVVGRSGAVRTRSQLLAADGVIAIVALVGAYLGGWYLLPAVVSFGILDAAGVPVPRPRLPRQRFTTLADATAVAAWGSGIAAIAAATYLAAGDVYSTASSSVDVGGATRDGPAAAATFLAINGTRGMIVLGALVILALAVMVGGSVTDIRGVPATWLLASGAAGLVLLAVLSGPSIGAILAPSAILAVAAWLGALRRARAS